MTLLSVGLFFGIIFGVAFAVVLSIYGLAHAVAKGLNW